jgi:antitoxin HicB
MVSEEYRLHLQIRRVENGQYLATSDGFPGLVAQGRTRAEAAEIAQDVAKKLIESYREYGDALPDGLHTMDMEVVELDIAVGI